MVALLAMAFWRTIADRRRRLWSLAPLSASLNIGSLRRRLEEGWERRCNVVSGERDVIMALFPNNGAVQTPLWHHSQSGDAIQEPFWCGCCRRSKSVESSVQVPVRNTIFRCCCRPPCNAALSIVGDWSWRRRFGVIPNQWRRLPTSRRCQRRAAANVVPLPASFEDCSSAIDDAATGDLRSFGAALDNNIYINSSNLCRWDWQWGL